MDKHYIIPTPQYVISGFGCFPLFTTKAIFSRQNNKKGVSDVIFVIKNIKIIV